MYMSTSIYFVTKLREILIIAEVNGDGGSTPLTKEYSADMLKYALICVGILVFLSGIILFIRSKQIFLLICNSIL